MLMDWYLTIWDTLFFWNVIKWSMGGGNMQLYMYIYDNLIYKIIPLIIFFKKIINKE